MKRSHSPPPPKKWQNHTPKPLWSCIKLNFKRKTDWIFIGRTDAEAETPILWPPDVKNWRIGKDPDAGKDWRQEKGKTQHEMVGWHHQLYGHEFAQAPGVGDGQRSLVCCRPWGCKESDTTERLNWTEYKHIVKKWKLDRMVKNKSKTPPPH